MRTAPCTVRPRRPARRRRAGRCRACRVAHALGDVAARAPGDLRAATRSSRRRDRAPNPPPRCRASYDHHASARLARRYPTAQPLQARAGTSGGCSSAPSATERERDRVALDLRREVAPLVAGVRRRRAAPRARRGRRARARGSSSSSRRVMRARSRKPTPRTVSIQPGSPSFLRSAATWTSIVFDEPYQVVSQTSSQDPLAG